MSIHVESRPSLWFRSGSTLSPVPYRVGSDAREGTDVTDNRGFDTGWHPDPLGRYTYRWWSGNAWSDQVHTGVGQAFADPMGLAPGPVAPGSGSPTAATPSTDPGFASFESPMPQTPYGPAPYVGPSYGQPTSQLVVTQPSSSSGVAVASLILGIGALFVSLGPVIGWFSIPFALVGLVLGVIGISRASRGFEGRGLAIAGVVTSVIALLVSLLWFVVLVVAAGSVADTFDQIDIDPSDGVCDQTRYIQDPDC